MPAVTHPLSLLQVPILVCSWLTFARLDNIWSKLHVVIYEQASVVLRSSNISIPIHQSDRTGWWFKLHMQ